MVEKELKSIWEGANPETQIKFDLSRLILELQARVNWFDKNVKRRDQRESIAAFFSMPLYLLLAWEVDFLIPKIAAGLGVLQLGFIVYKLRAARATEPKNDIALAFKEQLLLRKTYLQNQANLLKSVLFWYAGPLLVVNLIFIWGMGDPEAVANPSWVSEMLPVSLTGKFSLSLFFALTTWWIVGMNKKAVKNNVQPIIEELEKLEGELKED